MTSFNDVRAACRALFLGERRWLAARASVGLEADRVGWLPLAGLRPHNRAARAGDRKPSARAVPAKIVSTVFNKTVDRRNSGVVEWQRCGANCTAQTNKRPAALRAQRAGDPKGRIMNRREYTTDRHGVAVMERPPVETFLGNDDDGTCPICNGRGFTWEMDMDDPDGGGYPETCPVAYQTPELHNGRTM